MKKLIFSLLLLGSLPIAMLMAQQPAPGAQSRLLFDDDGGAVQVVPANLATGDNATFHGGAVMKSVQQVSIFLGSGWGDSSIRARESGLSNLASGTPGMQGVFSAHNISLLNAGPIQEDFSDLSRASLNDLTIQQKLADMLQSKAIPAPHASTVYVVFLGPGINSSLGGHKPGTDYAAYHNYFHLKAGEIRYVVVPFAANIDDQRAAAARALADAALNPNGNGWY